MTRGGMPERAGGVFCGPVINYTKFSLFFADFGYTEAHLKYKDLIVTLKDLTLEQDRKDLLTQKKRVNHPSRSHKGLYYNENLYSGL